MTNLENQIGTMVFSPIGNYIVGASDKGNMEFRNKTQDPINIGNKNLLKGTDEYIHSSEFRKIDFSSENYNGFDTITEMPGSCFSYMDSYGQSVRKEIYLKIEEYCNGMVTDEQFRAFFIDTCKDMRVYHTQSRHTSGKNPKDNSQIIRQIYEIFQKVNVESMVDTCFEEGKCIASGWGGSEKNNWVYYDSKYNDKSMHLRQILQEAATSVAEDWNLDPIDYEMVESQSKYTVNGGMNFDSVWNFYANNRGIASLTGDISLPEQDFSLFYQENKHRYFEGVYTLESQMGICVIGFGDNKWELNVPFNRIRSLGDLADHFNVKDLFFKNVSYDNDTLTEMLERFDIYTRSGYSYYWGCQSSKYAMGY